MNEIEKLQQIIDESNNIVFFGGAGVSTESGIPDFRGTNGIYNQNYNYPPEKILSHSFFMRNPEIFYQFLREKMVFEGASPNACHRKLAELEEKGKVKAIITQNIDGLHQKAGSKKVIELHGTIKKFYCTQCYKEYKLEDVINEVPVPHCTSCTGVLHPSVVLYEEGLNQQDIADAINYIMQADTLIIGGTSLVVNPAASLVRYFRGRHLVIINKTIIHNIG